MAAIDPGAYTYVYVEPGRHTVAQTPPTLTLGELGKQVYEKPE